MNKNDGRVVSNFIVQALEGKNITIYGDGLQTRSFCFVDDLIHGIESFMETDKTQVGPMNLGNPAEFTVLRLAELIIEMTGSKSKIDFFDLPSDDPKQRKPDVTQAEKLINWQPEINLREGLEITIKYFESLV
jgi:UDP-glucuronate decarboxylase